MSDVVYARPTVSIVTPTIGRPSLRVMLDGLLPQLDLVGDEVFVIGDGPQLEAEKICAGRSVKYSEIPLIQNYGNPQRNLAIQKAKGDLIMFVDDDDEVMPGAIEMVRKAAEMNPGRPLMFKMHHQGRVLWATPHIALGNVSGQMFVVPNVKEKIGAWSGRYAADFDFITSTVVKFTLDSLVWRNEIIARQGLAGPGSFGREM